jgi:chromosomal replication initiator protein
MGEFSEALGEAMGRPIAVALHVDDQTAAAPDAPAPRRRLLVAPDPALGPLAGSPSLNEDHRLDRLIAGDAPSAPLPIGPNGTRRPALARPARPAAPVCEPPRLNPRYVFEEFVVGESNRYAHAAAEAVANGTVREYNPLFIYGGSGLGKTHLMQAIGHRLYAKDNTLRVTYVTSEEFINGFIAAIQNRKPIEFRNQFRNTDLLLLDDVQFLMGKERTQQEFFHTFNALHDAGKRIVMTSDRPPKELTTLEDRLRTRFEWGLLVDIQPPDLETRIAILRKKVEVEGMSLDNKVITFIAERLKDNIREMEGAVKRLKMAASLHDRAIDLESARDILSHLIVGSPQPRVSAEDVQKAVCEYFGISITDLLGTNRSKKFSQPRHLAQYLTRRLTGMSFPDIAQKFGGKDHTSIIYACRKVEQGIEKDQNMANIANYLERQVTKGVD